MDINNLSVRQKQIFQLLLNSNDYVSCKEIAAKLNVSIRTIKSDINGLKDIIKDMDPLCHIESVPSKGYKIQSNYDLELSENKYLSKSYFFTANKYLEDDIRQTKMFLDILHLPQPVTINLLIEKYYISRTTLYKDLDMIAQDLHKYHVELIYKPYQGIYIDGTEVNIRAALQNKLLVNAPVLEENDLWQQLRFTKENLLEFISSFAINKISDFELSNLYEHLIVLLMRCQVQKYIPIETLTYEVFVNEMEIQRAYEYFYQYKSEAFVIPRSEIIYFVLLLKGCNLGLCNQSVLDITTKSLQKLSKDLNIKLDDDTRIAHLSQYMYSLLIRNYNHFIQNAVFIDDIKEKHSVSFDISYYYITIVEEMLNIQIADSEVSYLSYFFIDTREVLREYYSPNKILVVSFRGTIMSKRLMSELRSNFSFYSFDICEFYELKQKIKEETYSFIISDVPVYLDEKIPMIFISHFLDSNDFKIIRKHIRILLNDIIDDYFKHRHIVSITNKNEFLKYISTSQKEYDTLVKREKRFTYFTDGAAIIYLYNKQSKTSVYYSQKGMMWGKKKIHYIFVINVTEKNKLLNYSKINQLFLDQVKARQKEEML